MPAVWGVAGQRAMRDAAVRAGLVPAPDSSGLLLLLEPEAASLHVANSMDERLLRMQDGGF